MERYLAGLEKWLLPLLAALLGFITVGVFFQIVLRYVFDTSFLWGDELSLFAFIWCVYLGAAIGVRRHNHFAFDFLAERLTGRAAGVQRLVVDLAILGVAAVLAIEGWAYSQLCIQRLSPALGITLFIPTIVIPLSGALMAVAAGMDVLRDFRWVWSGHAG